MIKLYYIFGAFLLVLLLSVSGSYGKNIDPAWLIVPGGKIGPISPNASESDLIEIFGKKNIKNEEIYLDNEGEETETGTVIYPNNPQKRIKILWKDENERRYLKRVELFGDKSYWTTTEGISLGTSLKELERINGHDFIFWGFGWDGGGFVNSWENGKLEEMYTDVVSIRLDMINQNKNGLKLSKEKLNSVIGEREVNSGNQVAQKINPTVRQMFIKFE